MVIPVGNPAHEVHGWRDQASPEFLPTRFMGGMAIHELGLSAYWPCQSGRFVDKHDS